MDLKKLFSNPRDVGAPSDIFVRVKYRSLDDGLIKICRKRLPSSALSSFLDYFFAHDLLSLKIERV